MLRAGWSSVQTLVGTRSSTSIQTSPKAHPASCTTPTVSALGLKWLGCDNHQPPPSSTKLANTSALHHVLMERFTENFTFVLYYSRNPSCGNYRYASVYILRNELLGDLVIVQTCTCTNLDSAVYPTTHLGYMLPNATRLQTCTSCNCTEYCRQTVTQ